MLIIFLIVRSVNSEKYSKTKFMNKYLESNSNLGQ